MPQTPHFWSPWKGTVLAAALGVTGGMLAAWSGVLQAWEDRTAQRLAASAPAGPQREPGLVQIVLEDLADEAWPWAHLDYAILLHAIAPYEPEVLGLEWPLHHRDAAQEVYERQLARQMKAFRGVVIAAPALAGGTPPAGTESEALEVEGDASRVPAPGSWALPQPAYRNGPAVVPLAIEPARAGRVPLVLRQGERVVPNFPLAVYGKWLGAYWPHSTLRPGAELVLRDFQKRVLVRVPVDATGALRLRPATRLPQPARIEFYTAVLSAEQMHNQQQPLFDLNRLRHNIVLATRAHPEAAVPARSGAYPGDLAAQAVVQLMTRQHWKDCPAWAVALMLTAAGLLMAWAGALPRTGHAVAGWLAGIVLAVADTWFFIRFFDLQLPLAAALVAGTLAWAASLAWQALGPGPLPASPPAAPPSPSPESPSAPAPTTGPASA